MSPAVLLLVSRLWFGDSPSEVEPLHAIDSALVTLVQEVEVPARSNGVLASLDVSHGDLVRAGEALGRLDEVEAQLAVERMTREVEIARRQADSDVKLRAARRAAEVARRSLKRAEDSIERRKDSVSEAELDQLSQKSYSAQLDVEQVESDREIARSTLQLKEVELRQAEYALELRRIAAPISGMVAQIHQQEGEWAEMGRPLIRLVRLDRLRVEAFLKSAQIDRPLTGHRVTLTLDLPGRPQSQFAGTVTFVSPEVNAVNGQVRVWAEVENTDLLLRPGIRGRLEILKARAAPADTLGDPSPNRN